MNDSFPLPALLGGPAARPQGPPDWPTNDPAIEDALRAAWRDGSWGKYHGGSVERLEGRLAEYHDLPFVTTCASGTYAVEVALRALKIGPGDEVILAAYDYPGNFLAVHAVGANPVLIDVDADNWNLHASGLAAAIGLATRAVIASHLHGGVVPMRELTELAGAHGLRVIEDAAQAPGSLVQGRKAGTWGDVGILSFGGSKLLTAGRGGALLTRHPEVQQRARLHLLRGNLICPLSELQATVLLPQIEKLDQRNARRRQNVQRLSEQVRDVPGLRLHCNRADDSMPGYYKLGFQYDSALFGLPRDQFVTALRAEGVAFDKGFDALHVGRAPSRFRAPSELREARRAHDGSIVLHHPVLLGSAADVDEVALAVRKVHKYLDELRTVFA